MKRTNAQYGLKRSVLWQKPARAKIERDKRLARYIKETNMLVEMSKGRVSAYDYRADYFYRLFSTEQVGYSPPKYAQYSSDEIREFLFNAWWVSEDDIRQEIAYITKRYHFYPIGSMLKIIGRCLRKYLIYREKVIDRQLFGTDQYTYEMQQKILTSTDQYKESSAYVLLEPQHELLKSLSIHDRYLLYLLYIHQFTLEEIAVILHVSAVRVFRILNEKIYPKIKEFLNEKNTGSNSKRIHVETRKRNCCNR